MATDSSITPSEFSRLCQDLYEPVLHHARRLGPPRHQEEAVQNAFADLQIRYNLGTLESIQNYEAWLKTVTHNHLRKSYRDEKVESQRETSPPTVTSSTERAESRADLRKALMELDPITTALILEQLDGYSIAELASRYGRTERSITSDLYRGRRRLKKLLSGKEEFA